jgi:four helix bundle protein
LRIADCGLRIADRKKGVSALVQSQEEFKKRTQQFAVRVIRLVNSLPDKPTARVVGNQLLRSGTSVGANNRAACRARSPAEFIAKMGIVEEEADESVYWMELLIQTELVRPDLLNDLLQEANEITAMVVASITTARRRKDRSS